MKAYAVIIIVWLFTLVHPGCRNKTIAENNAVAPGTEKKWWKEATVYQIYPRSFHYFQSNKKGRRKGAEILVKRTGRVVACGPCRISGAF